MFTLYTIPNVCKNLIILTVAVSLGAALINPLFVHLFNIPGPYNWLALSSWGMNHYLFFQPFTALFVQPGGGAIGFSTLITLTIQMGILYSMGGSVCERIGEKAFLYFYLIIGGVAHTMAYFLSTALGGWPLIAGPTPSIVALLIFWMLESPNALLFFVVIPIQAKWLTLSVLGALGIIALSSGDLPSLASLLTATLLSYFYALLFWRLHAPFPSFTQFELKTIRLFEKLRKPFYKSPSKKNETVIVEFPTSRTVEDKKFIDDCLEKIAKGGKKALSREELNRLDRLSKK